MYYHLHKNNITENIIRKIPNNFNLNKNFEVKMISVNADIKTLSNGLQLDQYSKGSVFIHGGAFSPPGCLHFKVNQDQEVHKILMYVKSPELGINNPIKCFFILINDLKNTTNKDIDIQNIIKDFS